LMAARRHGARIIVDWHSRTAAMLALRLGDRHLAVRGVNRLEGRLARKASGHFAVSSAMRDDLRQRFGIDATVLHDRPRVTNAPLDAEPRLAVMRHALDACGAPAARDNAFVLASPTS